MAEQPTSESLTRITIRPLGSPLPLGFFAFGCGVMLTTAFDAHWISPGQQPLVAALALGFVLPLELLATVFGFLARDTAGATTMGLFAASWSATGLVLALTAPESQNPALAFLFGILGVSALVLATTALASKPFFSLILTIAAARFGLSAARQAGASSGALAAILTIIGVALVVISLYGAAALLVEEGKQRTVLPLFRRGGARSAVEGDLGAQLSRLTNEPGVRHQL